MGRLSKKNVLAVVLLIGVMYILNFLFAGRMMSRDLVPQELTFGAQRSVSEASWVERGGYLPLNVTYRLLAGAPRAPQRFLSIGMSSVRRRRGSYLLPTLSSLFLQSSSEERSSMVVVVLLADFDVSWRIRTARDIQTAFAVELDQGQLVVLHVPQDQYPSVTGLKRNYNDAPERVSFRSKQNLDYSFLIHYSAGLGRYYLQLEDDVSAAKNFLSVIRRRVAEQEEKKTTWAMLEFSVLGYIGKLYKSAHLPLLARFLFLFYQEMPCDWLMARFRELLTQKEPIVFKPSLFQHMGTYSSFQGTHNRLKDKDFDEESSTNPPAQVYSDMSTYQNQYPKLAWDRDGFFWGRSPGNGSYLTAVLTDPAVVTGIFVETGSEGKDLLRSARVEIGRDVITTDRGEKSCEEFESVGMLENGRFEELGLDRRYPAASSCLRVMVTAGQKDWVIIKRIRITTK
ncbi:alpha-1,3-mannosyl-glycoprotein 4-beta-N-acetylglucosaminyltransferase C isoform X1 [Pseudoliparis swirei]|uniref:alpha-1,3-mannosyl-glycoprotein 4-beta-N-acetylglucosaminyltransferase C isoform X1 n=2 Tax=Pseudoliparis swirei TaxID=2059687 RepID=UPI0024BE4E93|nr:alpha-1,3-mannosyl-glycoprotein 4-beta-N-acetylglucosaminyltransferase C isoform X1 [Pseudoliparis swirei]XP_056278336.1 alpha-1,3-mannosyl-glycoprotein 4-beta-N-acetylglucosaminyltransferase C isoform X1 [Pseudoliparis swirei]